jgi:hypothetical protein
MPGIASTRNDASRQGQGGMGHLFFLAGLGCSAMEDAAWEEAMMLSSGLN